GEHKSTTPGQSSMLLTLLGGMFYTQRKQRQGVALKAFESTAKIDPERALNLFIDASRMVKLSESEVHSMLDSLSDNIARTDKTVNQRMVKKLVDEIMEGRVLDDVQKRLDDNVPFTDAVQERIVSLINSMTLFSTTEYLSRLASFQPSEKAPTMISKATELIGIIQLADNARIMNDMQMGT
ncbi:MAG: hypothetical protein ABIG39_05940, partial [Candidatus Micrarchaeota archaeon]